VGEPQLASRKLFLPVSTADEWASALLLDDVADVFVLEFTGSAAIRKPL